jgi:hypothetical protein
MRAAVGLFPMLLLILVITAITVGVRGRSRRGSDGRSRAASTPAGPVASEPASDVGASGVTRGDRAPEPDEPTLAALDRWVTAGLMSADQRTAIATHEARLAAAPGAARAEVGTAVPRRRVSAAVEGLGYLGGMLTVSGLSLIVINAWPDLSTAGRLALSGGAAAVLLTAGRAAPEGMEPAFTRLRWFLWLAGTAAAGLFSGVAVAAGDPSDVTVALAAATTVAVVAAVLWQGKDRPLQQLCLLGGLAVAVGTLVAELASAGAVGLAVWTVGAGYLVVGLRRMAGGHVLFEGAGSVAAMVGAIMVGSQWEGVGLLFLVATAFGLLALASLPRVATDHEDRQVIGAIGGLAFLQGVPSAIGWFAEGAGVLTGLAVWLAGTAVVLLGVRRVTRVPLATELLGGLACLVGAAVTATQVTGSGPLLGIGTALALVTLGARRDEGLVSALGAAGLLVNIPWAITHFFPGEGRIPLAAVVTGALFVGLALWLGRSNHHHPGTPRAHPA